MGATYRLLAAVEEAEIVLEWFRALPENPVEHASANGSTFYFQSFGPLADAKNSPVVSVINPVRKCGVLTTIGEVHFLPTPITKFAGMKLLNRKFRRWFEGLPRIFSHAAGFVGEWNYFLEGSARNWDSEIRALPRGLSMLEAGSYFVSHDDNDWVLDRVCRSLDLRGVQGIEPPRNP